MRQSRAAIATAERNLDEAKRAQAIELRHQYAVESAKGEFIAANDELERATSWLKTANETEPLEKERIDGAIFAVEHVGRMSDFMLRLIAIERLKVYLAERIEVLRSAASKKEKAFRALAKKHGVKI